MFVVTLPFKENLDDPRFCVVYAVFQGDGVINEEEVNKDLRSRGLCLIPVGCTVHVAGSNGADFWSSAAIGNNVNFTISQAVKRHQDR